MSTAIAHPLFTTRTDAASFPDMDSSAEPTVDIATIAARHKVTIRAVQKWLAAEELDQPQLVTVPGTRIIRRLWPASILEASDRLVERKRRR